MDFLGIYDLSIVHLRANSLRTMECANTMVQVLSLNLAAHLPSRSQAGPAAIH